MLRAVRGARAGGMPVVTYALIGINVVLWLLELLTGGLNGLVYYLGAYFPPLTETQPWRMLTSAFLHSPTSILHIVFNMYSLWVLGPQLEHLLGRGRFVALYLLSAFGGSVGVLLLAPQSIVLGASGAIFGLFGAFFVIARRLGGNATSILIVIAINLGLGFIVSGVAWQAHLGGLITGAAVGLVFVATRARRRRRAQVAGIAGIGAALVAITVAAVALA